MNAPVAATECIKANGMTCPACYMDMVDGTEVAIMQCKHFLCKGCYDEWSLAEGTRRTDDDTYEGTVSCPYCRDESSLATIAIAKNFDPPTLPEGQRTNSDNISLAKKELAKWDGPHHTVPQGFVHAIVDQQVRVFAEQLILYAKAQFKGPEVEEPEVQEPEVEEPIVVGAVQEMVDESMEEDDGESVISIVNLVDSDDDSDMSDSDDDDDSDYEYSDDDDDVMEGTTADSAIIVN